MTATGTVATASPVTQAVDRVALVGLPGCGKSTVARLLARRRGWRLVDVDAAVERVAGRRITEIFEHDGESGFRTRELAALTEALAAPGPLVVACGGGLVTTAAARDLLTRSCVVVWLDGPDPVLLERLGTASDRPLLHGDRPAQLAALRRDRHAHYATTATLRVDVTGSDAEEVCDRVEDAVAGTRLPPRGPGTTPPGAPSAHGEANAPITVALGERSYRVHVGAAVLDQLGALLPEESRRIAVVVDRAVLPLGRRVLASVRASGRFGALLPVRGGESLKTWARAGRMVRDLASLRLERADCVVAVGGGTVGDVAGFAAATYLRGIAVVHVPTTLLAMVDSAVGGKTGVNLPRGKNLAGAFWQPHAVLCDVEALGTLGRRPLMAAFAEIVKYAMIRDDPVLVACLENDLERLRARDVEALTTAVRRCCTLKAQVVAADEREAGERALLNYGHTVGHALEAATGYSAMLHGEAVAVGMRVAGRLSMALTGCPTAAIDWQDTLLARCDLGHAPAVDPIAVLARTAGDKKSRAGEARWVLVERRGVATAGHVVAADLALAALTEALS